MTSETLQTYCPQCISRCGCLATVEDGRLVRVDPDPSHPTGGALCGKGRAAPELVGHPERLTAPLLRTRPRGDADPGWRKISWDEALVLAGERLRAAGPLGTAFAAGNPDGALADSLPWLRHLARTWGSPYPVIATGDRDREAMAALTWGRGQGMPDYARTETILLWRGATAPPWPAHAERIRAARQRDARLIVVGPMPINQADEADLWLPARPGTDAALALGLIHLLLSEGGADLGFLHRHSDAFHLPPGGHSTVLERISDRAALWPPRRVTAITGIKEEALRQAADWLGHRKPVSFHAWPGFPEEADLAAARAIPILYALTGSLGRPGGNRWFPGPDIGGIGTIVPPRGIGLSHAAAEEQSAPLQAMVAFGRLPAWAGEKTLAGLDFLVNAELFATPTARRWADLLLPATSGWEREGLQAGFQVDEAAAAHIQLRPAVAEPPGDARPDTDIVFALARTLGLEESFFGGCPESGLAHVLAPSGLSPAILRAHQGGLRAPVLRGEPPVPLVTLWSEALALQGQDPLPSFEAPRIDRGPASAQADSLADCQAA